jgi:hypothetical protein
MNDSVNPDTDRVVTRKPPNSIQPGTKQMQGTHAHDKTRHGMKSHDMIVGIHPKTRTLNQQVRTDESRHQVFHVAGHSGSERRVVRVAKHG